MKKMATSSYFNNFANSQEQKLIDDLIVESIKIYGLDVWYLTRTVVSVDKVLNEDDLSDFTSAINIEAYVKNVDGFEGEGDLLTKFGIEVRESMTFSVALTTFNTEVGQTSGKIRPNEGDIIYFPLDNKLFEIKHVDEKPIFFQLGALQLYDLYCELYEYSNETFNTGVAEIDAIGNKYRTDTANGIANVESIDILADNFTIETEADDVLDFSEGNPFSENY